MACERPHDSFRSSICYRSRVSDGDRGGFWFHERNVPPILKSPNCMTDAALGRPTLRGRITLAWESPGIGVGVMCGILSAIFYTLANIALRQSTSVDPFLVSAVKAAPTVLFLAPVVFFWGNRNGKGGSMIQSWPAAVRFSGVSLVGQVIGNGAFQIALGSIGLAASVPIAMGSLLIGGAVLGRVFLGEPVSVRKMISIGTLVAAVLVLSISSSEVAGENTNLSEQALLLPEIGSPNRGATLDADTPVASPAAEDWTWQHAPVWLGALCAVASGSAYAFFSSMMRRTMQRGMPAVGAMWISGCVGTVALWLITLSRDGVAPVMAADASQWQAMAAAGLFNFIAFIAISTALRVLPVVAVHLLNASQVAMAATAGVLLFAEPLTGKLLVGIALTVAGLLALAQRRVKPPRPIVKES